MKLYQCTACGKKRLKVVGVCSICREVFALNADYLKAIQKDDVVSAQVIFDRIRDLEARP
jgi:predicted ATP-dependent serine protease